MIDLPALALNSLVGQVSKLSIVLSLCKENKNRRVPEHNGGKGKKDATLRKIHNSNVDVVIELFLSSAQFSTSVSKHALLKL